MERIPTWPSCTPWRPVKGMTTKGDALTAMLVAALAACPGAAPAQPKPAGSLCRAPEAVLFTCAVEAKTVSICGQEQGGAVYRFGHPGRVEIEVANLHLARHTFWGGGETQVYADTPTHRYVVYDRMVRIGYDREGHNIPKMTQGLLVQSHGQTAWQRQCAPPTTYDPHTLPEAAFDQQLIEKLIPEGEYVDH